MASRSRRARKGRRLAQVGGCVGRDAASRSRRGLGGDRGGRCRHRLRAACPTAAVEADCWRGWRARGPGPWPGGVAASCVERTMFSWPIDGVAALTDGLEVEIGTIARRRQVRAVDLGGWQGLVLALPLHKRLSEGSMEQIVTWVRSRREAGGPGLRAGRPSPRSEPQRAGEPLRLLRFNGDALAPAGLEGRVGQALRGEHCSHAEERPPLVRRRGVADVAQRADVGV